MKKFINWGFVGLGNASLNLAKEFEKLDNSNLLAVASHNEKNRILYKNKFKLENNNIFSDYEDVFKHPNVDIVYIGLPNSLHERYCFMALEYNKNILVEKPITKNVKNFKKLKKKFSEKQLLLEEGTAYKFHPFYKQIIKEILNIDYSNILGIKSSFGNDALGGKKIFGLRFKKINHEKRLFNKKLDGGSILDGGVYPVSLLIDILYLYKKNFLNDLIINSCKKKKSNDVDIESSINISLNKIEIELQTSLINNLKNNFEIYTKNEVITFENIFTINENSALTYEKNSHKNIFNKNKENVYFYEVNEISNYLINQDIYQNNYSFNSLNKLEDKIELLSSWFNY
jgi:predicted dehydrogenase